MIALLLALLSASAPAAAAGVSGKVVDAQDLPVAGARVEIVCDGRATHTTTDERGEFSITVDGPQRACTVSAARDGFARITGSIPPGGVTGVVLQLQVAPITEAVRVAETAPMPELRDAIGSVLLDGDDLFTVFSRTEDMIRFAGLVGGATTGAAVYVDGLPVTVMPAPELVGQIRVNATPFSAEYGDGDITRIQITTRPPSRRFRVSPGASFLGFGGGDRLGDGLHSTSSSGNVTASGPIPGVPLTFSTSLQSSMYENELAIQAVRPDAVRLKPDTTADPAIHASRSRSGTFGGYYAPSAAIRAQAAFSLTRAEGSNVGVGALVLPESGLGTRSSTDGLQTSVNVVRQRLLFEGSFVARRFSSSMRANSDTQGLSVAGQFVGGGAPIALQESDRGSWMAKQVTRSSSFHPWAAGVVVGGTSESHVHVPNALGSLAFESADSYAAALAGAPTATWLVSRGNGSARYRGLTVSPFVQKTLVRTARLQFDGGVRADYQTRAGTVVSPRLWAATSWRGLEVQAGAGLFVRMVPDQVFVNAIVNDGSHLHRYIASGASLPDLDANLARQTEVQTRLAPGLQGARQVMQRVAAARAIGRLKPAIEYTFTRDTGRPGSDRIASGDAWIDVIDDNRHTSRHRVKTSLQYAWKGQSLSGHYEWLRAFDDGDGPFSYPESQGQFASEWARSAGQAPHSVTAASTLRLPFAIYAAVTDTWQSASPYNVTAGIDTDRNGLFVERGGRARNSGTLPAQHLLSVHASRRLQLSSITARGRAGLKNGPRLNVGVHLDNLLDNRNYTVLGSVAGSSTFGRPLMAASSRSARVSFSID